MAETVEFEQTPPVSADNTDQPARLAVLCCFCISTISPR